MRRPKTGAGRLRVGEAARRRRVVGGADADSEPAGPRKVSPKRPLWRVIPSPPSQGRASGEAAWLPSRSRPGQPRKPATPPWGARSPLLATTTPIFNSPEAFGPRRARPAKSAICGLFGAAVCAAFAAKGSEKTLVAFRPICCRSTRRSTGQPVWRARRDATGTGRSSPIATGSRRPFRRGGLAPRSPLGRAHVGGILGGRCRRRTLNSLGRRTTPGTAGSSSGSLIT
jgi:hypothetical protein